MPNIAQAGLIWLWGVDSDTIITVPAPAAVTVEALSPFAVTGSNILAAVSQIEVQAQPPLVTGFNVRPPEANLQIAAQAPAVATGINVVVPANAALQVAAQAPAVATGARVAVPAPGDLQIAAQAPAVATGARVPVPAPADLQIAAQAPAVYANNVSVADAAVLQIDAPTPTITIGPDAGFSAGKGRRTPLLRPGRALNPG